MFLLGIESDGTLKAGPTLPTEPYGAGNLLETALEDLWERAERMRFARERTADELCVDAAQLLLGGGARPRGREVD